MALRERPTVFYNLVFREQTIRVDGAIFDGCVFHNCKLEFGAAALPTFRRCRFADSDWIFVDAAANMLAFLSQLPKDFGEPGRDLFKQLFEQLQGARLAPSDPPALLAETKVATAPVSALVISTTEHSTTARGTTPREER